MKRIVTLLLAMVLVIGMMALFVNAATNVTVTADVLNIRKEPSANSEWAGSLNRGAQVTVLETKTVDGYTWGRIDNGWIRLDYTNYQSSSQPAVSGNWKLENGKWYYYINGNKATGWVKDGGSWYYLNSDGVMQTGWVKVAGSWYYMNGSGVMQTGWGKINGRWHYFNGSGVMQSGWLQLGSTWYYFEDSGAMVVGKLIIDGQAHKFSLDGVWQGKTANAFGNEGMRILKLEEGFSVKPYWDYTQWTVGYGTECPADMLEYYKANGISQSDAEALLREHMAEIEADIDKFVAKYGLTLNQNQYDALVLFSYNCGTAWCSETTGTFHNAIKNQATGSDLIHAFALWCSAGGEIKDFLVRRRLSEANMYLNGVYSQTPPENYCFVKYDANGGATNPKCQGYDALLTAQPYPVPTYEGYTFDGWYTAKSGGTKVTVLDASHNNTTLYAHWAGMSTETTPPAQDADRPILITVNTDGVNLRIGPGTEYGRLPKKSQANTGDQLTIVETYSGPTLLWGKFTEHGGGWICLTGYTNYDAALNAATTSNTWVLKDGIWYYYKGLYKQTGWLQLGYTWYYLNPDGSMATGWKMIDGHWFYLRSSGAMATGWLQQGSTWYYLNAGGSMATGWKSINGKWYFFRTNGSMHTGWLQSGSNWYYLKSGGAMATGWLQLGNQWYYLENSGVMVTGEKTIGPVTYKFASNGVWIG